MAKPNYSYEKRQREIAKKKQQDAKDARKREEREALPASSTPPQERVCKDSAEKHRAGRVAGMSGRKRPARPQGRMARPRFDGGKKSLHLCRRVTHA